MSVQWKKYFFTIREIYESGSEDEDEELSKADMYYYYQQPKLIGLDKWCAIHKKFLTLCVDLNKTEEQLRKALNRTTRYQINRGSRDELSINTIREPSLEDINEFKTFYNAFSRDKGIELFREDRVRGLKLSGMLVMTYVCHKDGRKLAGHLYIANGKRATMLYSCSGRFANTDIPNIEIGRANRYLHWHDMLFFKEQNYKTYDFLGLSLNVDDRDHQNINKFKKGFGGEEVIEYQSFIPKTLRGRLLVLILKVKWRNQFELIKRKKAYLELATKK
ncbi:peptidoglycan bridge formation glycyltransferase FemA/FemB family protein [Lentibacillus salinarum]|uniref:Lipid II:glycine glycyltransferase n=1 Tax=Lentibacillus salinarum TaxID=446820 RepID=A0ABW3ZRJ9_9BACI